MTGHQPSPTTGKDAIEELIILSIPDVAKSLGIERITVVDAYNIAESKEAVKQPWSKGPAVVVLQRVRTSCSAEQGAGRLQPTSMKKMYRMPICVEPDVRR